MPDQGPFWMLLDGSVEYHHPGTPHAQLLPVRLEGTKNTSMAIRGAAQVQEAHFFVLTMVASRAEVREGSVLWQLIQSLPPLISATAPERGRARGRGDFALHQEDGHRTVGPPGRIQCRDHRDWRILGHYLVV